LALAVASVTVYHLRDRPGDQDIDELIKFLDFIVERKVKRYLEIGSRNGDSFYAVMMAIGPGGFGLAIDMPENENAKETLLRTAYELNDYEGIEAVIYHGNSRDNMAYGTVAQNCPYDLVLIDADHTYEGVKADWYDYSPMAKIKVLHDVAAPDGHESDGKPNCVGQFWREIERGGHDVGPGYSGTRRGQVIVSPGSTRGFGIVF
jgi:hypothetical protein